MVLHQDMFVVADAVLDRVHQVLRHGPASAFIKGQRCDILDPGMQFKCRVPTGDDHRLALGEQLPTETDPLVARLNKQVHESMTMHRDMTDRDLIDYRDQRLEL